MLYSLRTPGQHALNMFGSLNKKPASVWDRTEKPCPPLPPPTDPPLPLGWIEAVLNSPKGGGFLRNAEYGTEIDAS